MLEGLLGGEPLLGVDHQQLRDEVLRVDADLVPVLGLLLVPCLLDVPLLRLLVALERHVPEKQDEDGDAQAPQVALGGVALAQNLWGDVGQSSAAQAELGVWRPDLAKAKVDELQVIRFLALVQKILELDVPVNNVVGMYVGHRQQHLPRGGDRVLLGEPLPSHHALEELAPAHALHHEAQELRALVAVDEPHNVRVVHAEEYLGFGLELLLLFFADAVQLEALDRAQLLGVIVLRQKNLSTVASAQDFARSSVVVLEPLGQAVIPPSDGSDGGAGRRAVHGLLQAGVRRTFPG
mmetsp:Transcript_94327/g.266687  ORF Transcript_94327/g.266687 Transcript_94327/m.266687 type:complete len:294 (+) Transcript_94327:814-1695(+)